MNSRKPWLTGASLIYRKSFWPQHYFKVCILLTVMILSGTMEPEYLHMTIIRVSWIQFVLTKPASNFSKKLEKISVIGRFSSKVIGRFSFLMIFASQPNIEVLLFRLYTALYGNKYRSYRKHI